MLFASVKEDQKKKKKKKKIKNDIITKSLVKNVTVLVF